MRKKEEERCKKEIKKRQKTEGENLEEKEKKKMKQEREIEPWKKKEKKQARRGRIQERGKRERATKRRRGRRREERWRAAGGLHGSRRLSDPWELKPSWCLAVPPVMLCQTPLILRAMLCFHLHPGCSERQDNFITLPARSSLHLPLPRPLHLKRFIT